MRYTKIKDFWMSEKLRFSTKRFKVESRNLSIVFLMLIALAQAVFADSPICTYQSPDASYQLLTDGLDCSGNNRDLSNHNVVFGLQGAQITSADYLSTADTAFVDIGTGDITICFNASFPSVSDFYPVTYYDNINDQGWQVRMASGADLFYQPKIATQQFGYNIGSANTPFSVYCWRRNSSTGYIYKNGTFLQSITQSQSGTPTSNTFNLTIGALSFPLTSSGSFTMNSLNIWTSALTDAQIEEFSAGLAPLVVEIDWDNQNPFNNDFEGLDPTLFYFNLTNSDTNTQCSLYTNDTGSFAVNVTGYGFTNGENSISYDAIDASTYTIQAYLVCNDTTGSVNSTTKTINFDFENVLIDINFPANNSLFNEDSIGINLDVQFMNTNLDDIFYEIYDPDGVTLLQSNQSIDTATDTYTFSDGFTFAGFGEYRIVAYGNDSANNFNNKTHYFTLLDNDISVVLDAPANNSLQENTTTLNFDFTLTLQNLTSADCELFEDGLSVDSDTGLSSGSNTLTQNYAPTYSNTHNYYINCTSSTFSAVTLTHTISIENSEPFAVNFGFLSLLPLLFIIIVFIYAITNIKKVVNK